MRIETEGIVTQTQFPTKVSDPSGKRDLVTKSLKWYLVLVHLPNTVRLTVRGWRTHKLSRPGTALDSQTQKLVKGSPRLQRPDFWCKTPGDETL